MNIAHAYQTGIGLPDRDYYFKSDLSTVAIQNRTKIPNFIISTKPETILRRPKKNADLVYDIEKQLCRFA
jgi:putative endopeptidase